MDAGVHVPGGLYVRKAAFALGTGKQTVRQRRHAAARSAHRDAQTGSQNSSYPGWPGGYNQLRRQQADNSLAAIRLHEGLRYTVGATWTSGRSIPPSDSECPMMRNPPGRSVALIRRTTSDCVARSK
jgi:hypothetical protein